MLPLADELAVEQSTRGHQVQYGTYCIYIFRVILRLCDTG